MENDKPTYEVIEQELNEYKELLWQLSDEYRLNMGNIEKQLLEQNAKYNELEKKSAQGITEPKFSFISSLGLPACVLGNNGELIKYNNKFKFLIELLGFEIEEISEITVLLSKDKIDNLSEKLKDYLKSDDSVFQSIFKVENSFQNLINLILRVYKFDSGSEHLALFIELNKLEIQGLNINELKQNNGKLSVADEEIHQIKTEINIFAEKYETYTEVLKIFETNEDKTESTENLQSGIKQSFNLEYTRIKILEKLSQHFKDFIILLHQKYPDLTTNEEKQCMLIRAGLTYKEISALMDISINGVKIARNRLRKKLDLENDTKTSEFIDKV